MPVKLGSRLPSDSEARIEIIPLIDIMFFLLASFMLVSLSMVHARSVKVQLPTATMSTPETKKDFVNISVDKSGMPYLDKRPYGLNELSAMLATMKQTNDTLRVFLSGDTEARHGDIIRVLDLVRAAGIENVGFEIRPPAESAK